MFSEALYSAVSWIYGVNPEHANRIKFTESIQNLLGNIVEEYYPEMDWSICVAEERKLIGQSVNKKTVKASHKNANIKDNQPGTENSDTASREWTEVKRNKKQKLEVASAKRPETQDLEMAENMDDKENDGLFSDLSLGSDAPPTPQIVAVPSKIKFHYRQQKETVELYAFEIQCNRLEVKKVTECLEHFHKVDNTCTFIPYGLK